MKWPFYLRKLEWVCLVPSRPKDPNQMEPNASLVHSETTETVAIWAEMGARDQYGLLVEEAFEFITLMIVANHTIILLLSSVFR